MSTPPALSPAYSLPARRRGERVLYSVLLGFAVLLYVDPTYFGIGAFRVNRDIGPLKYLLVLFAMGTLVFDALVLSGKPARQRLAFSRGVVSGAGILAFGVMVLSGSLFARMGDSIAENFMQLAFACLFGFWTAIVSVCAADDPEKLLHRYFVFLGIALAYALPMIVVKRVQGGQAFHTEIFLVLPALAYWFMVATSPVRRAVIGVLMAATALALHKNIGYLTLGLCVVGILASRTSLRVRDRRVLDLRWLLAGGALAVFALLLALRLHGGGEAKFLPSGSVEVRSFVYHQMLQRFQESPFIGDFYSTSALVNLPFLEVLGSHHVTAHSDWLDALAHGGLVGFVLLLCSTLLPLRHGPAPAAARGRDDASRRRRALLAALWTMCAAGTLVSAFVSMLTALPIAFLFWTTLGFYVGFSKRL